MSAFTGEVVRWRSILRDGGNERTTTMLTSNPVEEWGKLLGDAAGVSAMLDRLLHHGHVLKCGPRSWRAKTDLPPQEAAE
jgi:DNA replication protein DnaC